MNLFLVKKSRKRVFCTIASNRVQVSIPKWVFVVYLVVRKLKIAPYSPIARYLFQHPSNFCPPGPNTEIQMIGSGRRYQGRTFVVREVKEQPRERKQSGYLEFEDGEQMNFVSYQEQVKEEKKYRLEWVVIESQPPASPLLRLIEVVQEHE